MEHTGDSDDNKFINRFLVDVGNSPASKELLVGAGSGWLTGYIFAKVGKVVAVAVGGGILLLHVASENDIIKVNWMKVNRQLDESEELINTEGIGWLKKLCNLAKKHATFTTCFIGGFLVAIGNA